MKNNKSKIVGIFLALAGALVSGPSIAHALIPLPVNQGGSGVNTITGLIKGNGIQPFSVATPGTDFLKPCAPLTTGSTLFADSSGQVCQDNPNFYYDSATQRLGIGTTSPIGGVTVKKTYTNPSGTQDDIVSNSNMVVTGSTYTNSFFGGVIAPTIGATNTQNWTGSGGLVGLSVNPAIASGATGSFDLVRGIVDGGSNLSTGNVVTYKGMEIHHPVLSSGTITNSLGLAINFYSEATNNTQLLTGTLSPVAGNWNIYSSTAYNNYFGTGNTGFGTTSPGTMVDIQPAADGTPAISLGNPSVSGILNSPANLYINTGGASNKIFFGIGRSGVSSGYEPVRFTNGGVGVGGLDPNSMLTLSNANNSNRALLDGAGTYLNQAGNITNASFTATGSLTSGASSSFLRGMLSSVTVPATNTQNWTGTTGLVGAQFNVSVTSGSSGTITNSTGFLGFVQNSASSTTITNAYAIRGLTTTSTGGVITNGIGGMFYGLGVATNNTGIYLATSGTLTTAASGNWGIYDTTNYNSSFLGKGIFGANATPGNILDVRALATLGSGLNIKSDSTHGLVLGYYNANNSAIWAGGVTPGSTNYGFLLANDGTNVQFNSTGTDQFNISDVAKMMLTASLFTSSVPATINGTISLPYVAKTANYTASASTDYEIDCTANTFTVTLPNASAPASTATPVFVVTNSGAGIITVTTVGGTQIVGNDGISTTATIAAGSSKTFHSTGTGYRIN